MFHLKIGEESANWNQREFSTMMAFSTSGHFEDLTLLPSLVYSTLIIDFMIGLPKYFFNFF